MITQDIPIYSEEVYGELGGEAMYQEGGQTEGRHPFIQ